METERIKREGGWGRGGGEETCGNTHGRKMQKRGIGREARGWYHEESVKIGGAREKGERKGEICRERERERGERSFAVCLDGGP